MISGTSLTAENRSFSVRALWPLAGAVFFAALLTGCGGSETKDKAASQTAAKVNKEEITVHQINNVLQQQRGLKPEMAASASVQVLERLIDQELAIQKAQEQKIDRDPKVVQQMESARREIISRAYIDKVGSGAPKPTPAEIKAYYDSKPNLFSDRKIYSFQELIIDSDPNQVQVLRDALTAAKDVNAFVGYLKANNFKFGGNQSSRAAEQLPLSSLDEIAKMKNGQALFSVTPKGVQVTVLAGTRGQPVDEVRAQPAIEQFLLNERKRKLVEDDLKALRKSAKIEYVGDYANGAPKSLDEKLNVSPSRSPLVDASASAGEYVPPPPAPLASAPAETAPAEPFTASSPSGKALQQGLKGFK